MTDPGRGSHDVMVVGEYYFDIVYRGLPEVPRLGADVWGTGFEALPGASYSTAVTLTRLGTRTGWFASFGNDVFSRMVLDEARRDGIDDALFVHLDRPARRVSSSFSFKHDRGFMSYTEEPESLPTVADLERVRPKVLLMQGFSLAPERAALLEAAREMGVMVCSDCQHTDFTLDTPGLCDMVALSDVFLPNATEAMALTGAPGAAQALELLAPLCPTVVVKCGPDGAIAARGADRFDAPAPKVEVMDTTGAGDCFNAGLVHGLLAEPTFDAALEVAAICGALAVSDFGARRIPTREGLEQYRR